MARIKRLVLDVLKPHQPNAVDFATALADRNERNRIKLKVIEVDEKTETIIVIVEGDDIDFAEITTCIMELGGTLHSIDEVDVDNDADCAPGDQS